MTKLQRLYDEQGQSPWLDVYNEQFAALAGDGKSVSDAYWDLVVNDVRDALGVVVRPVHDASGATDGFVSTEVALTLEDQGVAGFHESFTHVLDTLDTKARQLARR